MFIKLALKWKENGALYLVRNYNDLRGMRRKSRGGLLHTSMVVFKEDRGTKPRYIEQRFSENSPLELKKHCCSIVHKFVPCKVEFSIVKYITGFRDSVYQLECHT